MKYIGVVEGSKSNVTPNIDEARAWVVKQLHSSGFKNGQQREGYIFQLIETAKSPLPEILFNKVEEEQKPFPSFE